MNLKSVGSILAKVGGGLLQNAMPPFSNLAFAAINAALPDDKKLPDDATGTQAMKAIDTLPPDQKASLLEKELDVEIEEIRSNTEIIKALAESDASGESTRPYIAKIMAQATCFAIISFISFINIAIYNESWETIEKLGECWELVGVILAVATRVLTRYFGERTKEKEKRYELAGAPQKAGWLPEAISMFRKS